MKAESSSSNFQITDMFIWWNPATLGLAAAGWGASVPELSDPVPSLSAPLLTCQLCLYFEKGQKTHVSQIYFLARLFILSSAISCISIWRSYCCVEQRKKNSKISVYFNLHPVFTWRALQSLRVFFFFQRMGDSIHKINLWCHSHHYCCAL